MSSRRGLIQLNKSHSVAQGFSLGLDDTLSVSSFNISSIVDRDDISIVSNRTALNAKYADENTSKAKIDALYSKFLDVLQVHNDGKEYFETIQDIIETCESTLKEVDKNEKRPIGSALVSSVNKNSEQNVDWLKKELATWRLLYTLYSDRILVQNSNDGEDDDIDYTSLYLQNSEKAVVDRLYTKNSGLREYQLVVDWLEAFYERPPGKHLGHATEPMLSWENTLFQLKKATGVPSKQTNIVQELDPDAPVREQRPLHALDEEDDKRLTRGMFIEIRNGRFDEAMALCKYSGQFWRAAVFQGWRLYEDPNYNPANSESEKLPIEGNTRRDLWKKCAWALASSTNYDDYYRAAIGTFCGHLEALKLVTSHCWYDLLWAYLKVQIDIRVESEIRDCCMRGYLPMPDEYWANKMTLEQIFTELTAVKDSAVRDYAKTPIAIIQRYLILDNIGELMQHIANWLNEDNSVAAHQLRFLTHLIVFMRNIGRVKDEPATERVISAYVDILIERGDSHMIAYYTSLVSRVSPALKVQLYSKFLERVGETQARSRAFFAGLNAGLDIESIAKYTVEKERLSVSLNEEVVKTGQISASDQRKISALEWLTFLPEHRSELLWQSNALIRDFMSHSKTECMRAAHNTVPDDSRSQINSFYGTQDELPYRELCSIKEHICYKLYIEALDSFNEWTRLYHNQPKAPKAVADDTNFTGRIASEHKEQQYRAELKRWEINLRNQAKKTSDIFFEILLFPENGWLVDPQTIKETDNNVDSAIWEERLALLKRIRSIYIPEVVLLLHEVLHKSQNYEECVKLTEILASEVYQLFKVYTPHKLAQVLAKIAESSLELLNKKLDPWGFPAAL